MYQGADEVAAAENQYEIPQTGTDNSKSHQSSYTSILAHEMMEMIPASSNNCDRLGGEASQNHDYGKLLAEMRRLRGKVVSCQVVLLVLVLVLVLVFGATSVILVYFPASKDGEISVVTSTKATYTQQSSTHLTSTEATYTQQSSTHLTSTEATYTQRSFTYLISTENLGSTCLTAFYRADGNILVGTRDGVKLVNRRNMALTSYDTTFKLVTLIVEHNNVIYLLHEEGNIGKVELCLPDMNNCQTLLEFNNTSRYISTMTVSSRYIVVRNPDGNKLIIYDFISNQTKIKQSASLYFPYFLPDGHLLVVSGSSLPKYRLEGGELELLWACGGLTNARTTVADPDGFIYVLTSTRQSVYILSSDGELLQTIQNDKLPAGDIGQASINGDEIAVPGWDDNKLHLFKINK